MIESLPTSTRFNTEGPYQKQVKFFINCAIHWFKSCLKQNMQAELKGYISLIEG